MATEPLEYQITFDTSQVAQKLAEVKNSMDVAFGAQAFNAAGPDAYPFQSLFDSPALTAAKDGAAMAQDTFGSIQSAFNTMAETSRLGYSKFTRDLEMTGLMAGSMRGAPQSLTYGQHMQQIKGGDLFDDITGGVLGAGYSATMPMSRKEYQRSYKNEAMEDFMTPSWGEAGGAALGLAAAAALQAGPVGWTVAALPAAALATKAALYPFTSELRHQRAMEGFVGNTSWRFLSGQFGREDREDLGQYLRELPDQPGIAAKDYSRGEVDEMLSTFTEAGGFDYVRTAQEYKDKTKQLFDGHRELMHTLHIASKEAATLMGQLSRDLGVENFAGFSAQVGTLADQAGLTRTEAASFIMKSSEMVRGTGYNMENFALGAGRMLEDVTKMAREGIFTEEELRQRGGAEGIALNMARSAMNYAGSPAGFVSQAALMSAQLGGGGLEDVANMTFQQKLGATAGLFRKPWDFVTFGAKQKELADLAGPEIAMQQKTMDTIEHIQAVFGADANVMTGAEFEAAAVLVPGVTPQDASDMRAVRDAAANKRVPGTRDKYYERGVEALRQEAEEGESRYDVMMRKAGQWIEENPWGYVTERAEGAYKGIEFLTRGAGQTAERAWSTLTGGFFDTRTTKQAGLESAWRLGGAYGQRVEETIIDDLTDEQKQNVQLSIRKNLGKSELFGLSAEEATRELDRKIENIDRDLYLSIPRVGTGYFAVDAAEKLLVGLFGGSAESDILAQTSKDLGFGDRKNLQGVIARSAASLTERYEKQSDKFKQDTTLPDYLRLFLPADFEKVGGDLGKEGKVKWDKYLSSLSDKDLADYAVTGEKLLAQDRTNYNDKLNETAIKRIEAEGRDATPENIKKEMEAMGRYSYLGSIIGEEGGTIEERIAGGTALEKRLAASVAIGRDMFTQQGGVFDPESAIASTAATNGAMLQELIKFTTGNVKPLPMFLAEADGTRQD